MSRQDVVAEATKIAKDKIKGVPGLNSTVIEEPSIIELLKWRMLLKALVGVKDWEYHFTKLVVADDPVKYLEEIL